MSTVIRQVNTILKELCVSNNFHFISNDCIGNEFLWKDGIHLIDNGIHMLAGNFVDHINNYVLNINSVNSKDF